MKKIIPILLPGLFSAAEILAALYLKRQIPAGSAGLSMAADLLLYADSIKSIFPAGNTARKGYKENRNQKKRIVLTEACGMHRQKKGFFAVLVRSTSASWKNQMPCINIFLYPMVQLHPL